MPVALAGSVPLPHPAALSALLASTDPAQFFDEFSNFAAYFYPLPLEKWPPLFRMYHLVSALAISIDTGDLAGFFDDEEDHTGAYANETEAFLREIGAIEAAALLAEAIGVFPRGQVPKGHAARVCATEKLRDQDPEPFEEVARKHAGAVQTLYTPLQKYMRAHERELQTALDAAAKKEAGKKPKWRPLDAALALKTQADRIAGGAPKEHAALLAVWERIDARLTARGFEALTAGERLFHVLWFVMDTDIENGGLHQFFTNSSGDFGEEAKRHLNAIGANRVLAVLNEASAVFPNGIVPEDRATRNAVLEQQEQREGKGVGARWDALSRKYYQAAKTELYSKLLQWVKSHRDEFPDPERPKSG